MEPVDGGWTVLGAGLWVGLVVAPVCEGVGSMVSVVLGETVEERVGETVEEGVGRVDVAVGLRVVLVSP